MLEEKITLLIKALPKSLRRNFVPAPDFAAAACAAMTIEDGSLLGGLSRQLHRMTGVPPKSINLVFIAGESSLNLEF